MRGDESILTDKRGLMRVGHDGVQSIVFYLQLTIFNHRRLSTDGMLISKLHKAGAVGGQTMMTVQTNEPTN